MQSIFKGPRLPGGASTPPAAPGDPHQGAGPGSAPELPGAPWAATASAWPPGPGSSPGLTTACSCGWSGRAGRRSCSCGCGRRGARSADGEGARRPWPGLGPRRWGGGVAGGGGRTKDSQSAPGRTCRGRERIRSQGPGWTRVPPPFRQGPRSLHGFPK